MLLYTNNNYYDIIVGAKGEGANIIAARFIFKTSSSEKFETPLLIKLK